MFRKHITVWCCSSSIQPLTETLSVSLRNPPPLLYISTTSLRFVDSSGFVVASSHKMFSQLHHKENGSTHQLVFSFEGWRLMRSTRHRLVVTEKKDPRLLNHSFCVNENDFAAKCQTL